MTQSVYLTLNGGFCDEEIYAVQSDRDLSEIRCILRGYRCEPADTALLRATKPDGTVCYLAGKKDGENAFRFRLTAQMTAVTGDVRCDVSLTRGEGTVSSDEFLLKVRPPAAAGEMTESESEYIGFTELIKNTVNAQEITEEEIDAIWEEESV